MGVGDALMAVGEVRELRQGKPQAKFIIGDGKKSYWNEVFDNNPYIISESDAKNHSEIIWIKNYEGNRPYRNYDENLPKNKYNWIKYKPKKGEFFFSKEETNFAKQILSTIRKKIETKKLIFIEPHVKKRLGYENRDWGFDKWKKVVAELNNYYEFIQITYLGRQPIKGCINLDGLNFRSSAAILSMCDLFIGSEGGMHHAAAATNKKAVVIWGGHISPDITGYNFHTNLYNKHPMSPCGSKFICDHCQEGLKKISVTEVVKAIKNIL